MEYWFLLGFARGHLVSSNIWGLPVKLLLVRKPPRPAAFIHWKGAFCLLATFGVYLLGCSW